MAENDPDFGMSEDVRNYAENMAKMGHRPDGTMPTWTVVPSADPDWDKRTRMMVCLGCEPPQMLNRLTEFDGDDGELGEISWAHPRGWERYDHDPEPFEVEAPEWYERNLACDFCGVTTTMAWSWMGDNIRQKDGNFSKDLGPTWASCDDCEPFITADDRVGLIDRVFKVNPRFRKAQEPAKSIMRWEMSDLQARFMDSIYDRKYIGRPVVATKLNPRSLHKVQAGLRRFWSNPKTYSRVIKPQFSYSMPGMLLGRDDQFAVRFEAPDNPSQEQFNALANHIEIGTQAAQMYYVSEKYTRYATAAGMELKSISLRRDQLPSPHGLIFWETPVGEVQRPYGVAGIRAMGWTLVPGGIWINNYIQPEDGDPQLKDIAEYRSEWGFLQCPNIGTGIPFIENWGEVDDRFIEQGGFLLTLLATFWLLRQPGVSETATVPIDKKITRSIQRSTGRKPSEIILIDLRKRPRPKRKEGEVKHWELKYARRTPGHWRNQYYPSTGHHEPKFIDEYVSRGDLPWRPDEPPTPTVKVLR